jgi:hypothetical protein
VQEYITPQNLVLLTQLCSAAGGSEVTPESDEAVPSSTSGKGDRACCAVTPNEEEYFGQLRLWYQERVGAHKPYWLYPGLQGSEEELVDVQGLVVELERRVSTQEPGDMVRALYPCLFQKPVQNEQELVMLVREVVRRTGIFENRLTYLIDPPAAAQHSQIRRVVTL